MGFESLPRSYKSPVNQGFLFFAPTRACANHVPNDFGFGTHGGQASRRRGYAKNPGVAGIVWPTADVTGGQASRRDGYGRNWGSGESSWNTGGDALAGLSNRRAGVARPCLLPGLGPQPRVLPRPSIADRRRLLQRRVRAGSRAPRAAAPSCAGRPSPRT